MFVLLTIPPDMKRRTQTDLAVQISNDFMKHRLLGRIDDRMMELPVGGLSKLWVLGLNCSAKLIERTCNFRHINFRSSHCRRLCREGIAQCDGVNRFLKLREVGAENPGHRFPAQLTIRVQHEGTTIAPPTSFDDAPFSEFSECTAHRVTANR